MLCYYNWYLSRYWRCVFSLQILYRYGISYIPSKAETTLVVMRFQNKNKTETRLVLGVYKSHYGTFLLPKNSTRRHKVAIFLNYTYNIKKLILELNSTINIDLETLK